MAKIIKYGASWCGPCRQETENLQESKVPFEEVDIDSNSSVVSEKRIKTIPFLEFYKNDTDKVPTKTHSGLLTTKEIIEICESL